MQSRGHSQLDRCRWWWWWWWGTPPPTSSDLGSPRGLGVYLDQAKAQMCLVKEGTGSPPGFQKRERREGEKKKKNPGPLSRKPQRGRGCVHTHTHTHASYIPHEVLVGLLGVPLLPLLAGLHLGQQRLPVGLVRLDDVLQLLHEEQLQHALVRVQVGQLEQLPLQDVVVPDGGREAGRQRFMARFMLAGRCFLTVLLLNLASFSNPYYASVRKKLPSALFPVLTERPRTSEQPLRRKRLQPQCLADDPMGGRC